ncbi:MAG TPA: YdcF family protein [Bryobacteraceae bacterium]
MRRRIGQVLKIVLLALPLLAAAIVVRTAVRIERQSTIDEAHAADVILILGAAEYRGKPSPVLRGRLEHGLELYREKRAPLILTTGGAGGDPVFTEGEVGRDYLIRHGVPSEAILVETEGASTMHSLAASAEIMQRMQLKSCIVVSDGYHIYRAKKMLESHGFLVYGSPRPSAPGSSSRQWWTYVRQSVGYLLWRWGITI